MSNEVIIREPAMPLQALATMLPSVAARTTEAAMRSGGKGGRTAVELARLRREAESEGYEHGLERGLQEGIDQGAAEARDQAYQEALAAHAQILEQFQTDLAALIESIQEAMYQWCQESEERMTELVTDIAKTVLASELKISRDSVLAIVKDALKQVTHSQRARIRVNLADIESLQGSKQELLACAGSLRDIEFIDDPAVEAGCIIETDGGVTDATLATKLESLDEEMGA